MEHNYLHEIYDCVTGETTIVPFTEEEVVAYEAAKAENEARIQAEEQARLQAEADAAAKAAVLARLGLTEEEINAFLS